MSYNFSNAITIFKEAVTKQYWDVNGRTSRSDYWHFFSINILIGIVLNILVSVLASVSMGLAGIVSLLVTLVSLALLPPGIGMAVRRMHDVSKAWWFMLIPLYNLYLACMPGTPGTNEFGPNPLEGGAAATFA